MRVPDACYSVNILRSKLCRLHRITSAYPYKGTEELVREASSKLMNEMRDEILRPRGIASAGGKGSGRSVPQRQTGDKTRGKTNISNKKLTFCVQQFLIFLGN